VSLSLENFSPAFDCWFWGGFQFDLLMDRTGCRLRLNGQHLLLRSALGYTVHPSIRLDKEDKGLKIGDIGCGTG